MGQGTSRRSGHRLAICAALALLVAPASAGAADPWPSDGQNPFNTRYGNNWGPAASKSTKDLTTAWVRRFDSPVVGTPLIADNGGVYVATENGEVWGIVRKTGTKYWEQYAGGKIEGSLLKVGGSVYAVTSTATGAYLVSLDALTGDVKWRTPLDGNRDADSCGGPQYSATHDAVIVGLGACRADRGHLSSTMRGAVAAVSASSGAGLWKTPLVSAAARGGGVTSTPIVWDGGDKVFVTTGPAYGNVPDPHTDAFLRLDLTTGAIDGQFEVHAGDTTSNSALDVQKRLGFTSAPLAFAAWDGKAYLGAGAQDGSFYVIDPLTMTKRSATRLAAGGDAAGFATGAAFDKSLQEIVGVTSSPALYFAIDQGNAGALKWAFPGSDVLHRGPVAVVDNSVWSTDELGFVDIQYRFDGHTLGRYPIGQPSTGGISFYQDTAYVAVGVPSGTFPGAPTTGALYAIR